VALGGAPSGGWGADADTAGAAAHWIVSSLLLSLRVAPAFALAPPFSLTQTPALFRVLFGVAMAALMIGADPAAVRLAGLDAGFLVLASLRELCLGLIFVLALQLMFGALYTAGRTLDIQAGYGLASVIDPASGNQTPLIGTVFAYAAAAVFFSLGGHADLLRIMAASLRVIPLGTGAFPTSLVSLTTFMTTITAVAFGVCGGAILCLFVTDLAIALISRTVPQMNVLILGLQVKSMLALAVLPATLGLTGVLLVRMVAITLESIPRLL
jgi:flagellar biosynthesis protein FliR